MKTSDKYETQDEEGYTVYKDPETGINHNNVADLVSGMLNMCDCGDPESNLRYIRDQLRRITARDATPANAAEWFFNYWTDSANISEHGTGITYPWLTDKGQVILELLEELELPDAHPVAE